MPDLLLYSPLTDHELDDRDRLADGRLDDSRRAVPPQDVALNERPRIHHPSCPTRRNHLAECIGCGQ